MITIELPGVIKLLQTLNLKKAIGPDLVSTTMLKQCTVINEPIFQQSFNKEEIPIDWLQANTRAKFN